MSKDEIIATYTHALRSLYIGDDQLELVCEDDAGAILHFANSDGYTVAMVCQQLDDTGEIERVHAHAVCGYADLFRCRDEHGNLHLSSSAVRGEIWA